MKKQQQNTKTSWVKFTLALMLMVMSIVANAATYYSTITGNYSTSTVTQWNTNRAGGGSTPANFSTSGDIFIIQGTGGGSGAPHTVTTNSTWALGAGVTVQVEGGATLNQTSNITFNATAIFKLDAGSFFIQNSSSAAGISAGVENWNSTATITYTNTGIISSVNITNNSHPNVVFQLASNTGLGAAFADVGANPAVAGNLTVNNTAAKYVALCASAGNAICTVNGTFSITGGIFNLSTGTSAGSLNVKGSSFSVGASL
jgi:hypothetical protein